MTNNIILTIGAKFWKLIGFGSPRSVKTLGLKSKSSSEISPLLVTLPNVQDDDKLLRRQKVNSLLQAGPIVLQLEPPQLLLVGFW